MWKYRRGQSPKDNIRDTLIRIENRLNDVFSLLKSQGVITMSVLDDLTAEVARNTSVDESAKVLVTGLAAKIQELIDASAGSVDPAALQGLVDTLKADNDSLSAAVTANTPAAP